MITKTRAGKPVRRGGGVNFEAANSTQRQFRFKRFWTELLVTTSVVLRHTLFFPFSVRRVGVCVVGGAGMLGLKFELAGILNAELAE